jgi:tetratricopeptide (TPR) repeat protein
VPISCVQIRWRYSVTTVLHFYSFLKLNAWLNIVIHRLCSFFHRHQFKKWACLITSSYTISAAAYGLEACPAGENSIVPRQAEALNQLSKELSLLEPLCFEDAPYLAWYGAILSAQGQVDAAIVRLERALMRSPDLIAARIEYAVALGRSEHWQEAIDLVDQMLTEPELPETLRQSLKDYRRYWMQNLHRFWGSAQIQLGYSTNLNSAPQQRNHSLTFGDQQLVMVLAPSETERAGSFMLTELAGGYDVQIDQQNQLYTTGLLRYRHSPAYSETDYIQLDTALNWTSGDQIRLNRQIGLGIQTIRNEIVVAAVRTGAAYEYHQGTCLMRGALDAEWRSYPLNDLLNGFAPAVTLNTRCVVPVYPALQTGLQLRYERDFAKNDRVGGDQTRTELMFNLRHALGGGVVDGIASYQWQTDQTGYSPLLENNSIRNMQKTHLRLEYHYPLRLISSYSWSKQRSNISLFQTEEQSVWLGIRMQW